MTVGKVPPMDTPERECTEMDSTSLIYFSSIPQLLCLAVAVAAASIAAGSYWRRNRYSTLSAVRGGMARGKIIYHDTPTVRVVDSQRVDRMRKVVRLAIGEHIDILETRAGLSPRFRLTLKALVKHADADAAQLTVEFGGTRISCGPAVDETGFNEFVVPRAARDEPRSSIFHYHENGDSLDFMRIKVRSMDSAEGIAEIDVMQVSGHWPAS